ncbi:MAG: ABC transporter ATP-binding protein [Candidatus Omnitrophica bacterium]|nr:ABC transporter ATP-binding protein [Candidatus Omnitrophota bacterium]MBU1871247.1 ABC transporter ATP-binding protein [Candidatus Omnitrophota bacterium]
MLKIKDLFVEIAGKQIIKGVNLNIEKGSTCVLMGPNASGKTSLLMTIIGMPQYKITRGKIIFQGKDITQLPLNERAKMGIGIMFQKPPQVRGVKLRKICDALLSSRQTKKSEEFARDLDLTEHLERDLNYGFSGGELKRSELFQLLCQNPNLLLLDEPESGVDLDNIALVGRTINELLHPDKNNSPSGIIVTHTGYILQYVEADIGYVLLNGKIICEGNPLDLFKGIKKHGYERCGECKIKHKIGQKRAKTK